MNESIDDRLNPLSVEDMDEGCEPPLGNNNELNGDKIINEEEGIINMFVEAQSSLIEGTESPANESPFEALYLGISQEPDPDLPVATPIVPGREFIIDGIVVNPRARFRKPLIEKVLVIACVALVLCTSIIFSSGSTSTTMTPTVSPTISPAPTTFLNSYIKDLLIPISGEDVLDNPHTPQHHAWKLTVKAVPDNVLSSLYSVTDTDRIIQRYVMMVMALSLSGSFHTDASKHLSTQVIEGSYPDECDMFDCNIDGELTTIVVNSEWASGLFGQGFLPKEIGSLKALNYLILTNNDIKGTIPTEIGKLSNLKILDLSDNSLVGVIPSQIGDLQSIEWLRLDGNQLSGTIPSNIANLTELKFFNFSDNQLRGEVPSEIGNMANLKGFVVHRNHLTGNMELLCDNNLNNETFTKDISIGKSLFLEQVYKYSIEPGLYMDCYDEVPSFVCSCCLCS